MKIHLLNFKQKGNSNTTRSKRHILVFLILFFSGSWVIGQTSLQGKLTDAASGEAILFGTIALYKDSVLIDGAESDLDGNYFLSDIDPGTYDVEASYIGFTAQRQVGVIVKAGKTNRLDFALKEGVVLDHCEIIAYKVPLIEIDNTTSGATVTAESIRSLPTKNISEMKAATAGIKTQNGAISIRGRSDATVYYVDGIRTNVLSPQEGDFNNEEYNDIIENTPKSPFREPLSTFSIDVDRASYSNVRRYINDGNLPPADAVRIEEMINYFNYDYPAPEKKSRPFKAYTELMKCPWNENSKLLHIGIQGRKIEMDNLPSSNLVFLIDVSGSMNSHNKLPLVKESFKLLVEALREDDRVAIVTYAGHAGVALPSTSIKDKAVILKAIDDLGTGGGTAGAQGIMTAYDIARKNFIQDGNNRVLLATDGDFNIGMSSQADLDKLIEKERKSGVFLSVLGYGMGNYKDGRMQSLANKGNGNHSYIDQLSEAKRVLVEELGGTLHTIAKDVKVQIEFNPAYVGTYRLIGYENRMLNAEDFTDDTKDAGELGSGHSVTALYEIFPSSSEFTKVDNKLKYQDRSNRLKENLELGTLKLRYKTPGGHRSWEIKETISSITTPSEDLDDRSKHAAAMAEFGLILRKSTFRGDASYTQIEETLSSIQENKYMSKEALALVSQARLLDSPQ